MQRRIAIVTGAAGLIGSSISAELARQSYDLLLTDRSAELLRASADAARELGARVAERTGDLTDLAFTESLVKSAVDEFGQVDALVNNAGLSKGGTMRRITPDDWDQVIRINLTAPAFLARWAAADMAKRNKGVIVNIASIQAHETPGYSPAYVAAKGGLNSITYEMAILYGPVGIRVVSVEPGGVREEKKRVAFDSHDQGTVSKIRQWGEDTYPLGRSGRPGEIANAVAWLLSDAASYVSGTTLRVDGGVSHQWLPYSIKRLLHPNEF